MKKRIVLCADDYGQAPAISQGILALVQAGRLSAVICMVTTPDWPEYAALLRPLAANIDIGLHFNLTEGGMSLPHLIGKSLLRRLDMADLTKQLHTQIDAFVAAIGDLPQFIDGHQHVHQFPMVRDALVAVYAERFRAGTAYVRVVNANMRFADYFNVKKAAVHFLGARSFKRLLVRHAIPHNLSFSGMYDFAHAKQYRHMFCQFLAEVAENGVVMCHPGLPALSVNDPIADARYQEYQYLASEQFLMDCEASEVQIKRRLG